MDIPTRLKIDNLFAAVVFALYFFLQTYDGLLRLISFAIALPVAKIAFGRLIVFGGKECTMCCFPPKKFVLNLIINCFGVWIVMAIELFRRTISLGWTGCLSIVLMIIPLVGYFFSASTGVCFTNIKRYEQGTTGFTMALWIEFTISFLLGSGWVLNGAY
ncbi:MAG: hypothetical protein IJG84_12075 [Kiritimatiellae bacterium]|nr:hypothetical protein [Kiritimatiellia bacterium]